jgi:hypothetical protein
VSSQADAGWESPQQAVDGDQHRRKVCPQLGHPGLGHELVPGTCRLKLGAPGSGLVVAMPYRVFLGTDHPC